MSVYQYLVRFLLKWAVCTGRCVHRQHAALDATSPGSGMLLVLCSFSLVHARVGKGAFWLNRARKPYEPRYYIAVQAGTPDVQTDFVCGLAPRAGVYLATACVPCQRLACQRLQPLEQLIPADSHCLPLAPLKLIQTSSSHAGRQDSGFPPQHPTCLTSAATWQVPTCTGKPSKLLSPRLQHEAALCMPPLCMQLPAVDKLQQPQ